MNLSSIVETVNILNIDEELSNPSSNKQILISNSNIDKSQYVISDADAELLILVEFKQKVNLKFITLYSSMDSIDDDDEESISIPKEVYIYKLNNMNVNFDDLDSLIHDKSIKCSTKKLGKGQKIKLQKDSKTALKYKSMQYLAIFIKTNQDNSDKTLINNIQLNGEYEEKKTEQEHQFLISVIQDAMPEIIGVNDPQNAYCSVKECKSIARIINGLIRYQELNNITNTDSPQLPFQAFTDYLLKEYPNYLDDIHHLHIRHEYDLPDIMALFTQHSQYKLCDVDNCQITNRHCEISDSQDDNNMDPLNMFHKQTWDSVHFWFNHLYQVGLRQEPMGIRTDNDGKHDEDIDDEWNIIDFDMNRRHNKWKKTRKKYDRFYGRYKSDNNKYIIKHNTEKSKSTSTTINNTLQFQELGNYLRVSWFKPQILELYIPSGNERDTVTFTDDIVDYMMNRRAIDIDVTQQFMRLLKDERYDTESFLEDVKEPNNANSNIISICSSKLKTKNSILINSIKQYIKHYELSRLAFNPGIRMYYSEEMSRMSKARGKITVMQQEEIISNKYPNLKQELLYNKDTEVHIMNFNIMLQKSNKCMEALAVRTQWRNNP